MVMSQYMYICIEYYGVGGNWAVIIKYWTFNPSWFMHLKLNLIIFGEIGKVRFKKVCLILTIKLYSEKCTGRYFKVRDDVFKQGSLIIMYIQNYIYITRNIDKYIFTYNIIIAIQLKHNMNIFLIDRYFRILHGNRTWRLRDTFLKYPEQEL